MNRGFGFYYAKGIRSAATTLLKRGKMWKFYVYLLASLVGRVIPFFGGIFPVADVRCAKIARDENDMPLARSIEGADTGRSFGTAVLAFAIEFLLLVGGLGAFALIGYLLLLVGQYIGTFLLIGRPDVMSVIFALPAAVGALLYLIAALLLFAPTAYIIDSNKQISASRAITAAVETMRRGGKMTCFLNIFVTSLIFSAFGGFVYGGMILISLLGGNGYLFSVAFLLWILLCIVLCLVFAPVFILGCQISNTCLFEDISLVPAALDNREKGVFIKKYRPDMTRNHGGLDGALDDLFEQPYSQQQTVQPNTTYTSPIDTPSKMHTYTPPDGTADSTETDEPSQPDTPYETEQSAPTSESTASDTTQSSFDWVNDEVNADESEAEQIPDESDPPAEG